MVVGILIVVGIVNYYLIPPTLVIIIVFFKMRKMYMTTTRNVKRLEGVGKFSKRFKLCKTWLIYEQILYYGLRYNILYILQITNLARSPMYTHVNSSIQGLTTIRAFDVEQILSQEFASHQVRIYLIYPFPMQVWVYNI